MLLSLQDRVYGLVTSCLRGFRKRVVIGNDFLSEVVLQPDAFDDRIGRDERQYHHGPEDPLKRASDDEGEKDRERREAQRIAVDPRDDEIRFEEVVRPRRDRPSLRQPWARP